MENVPVSINNLEKAQWSHEHFILSYRKKKKQERVQAQKTLHCKGKWAG